MCTRYRLSCMPPREAPDSSSPSSSSVLPSVKERAGHERARWAGGGRIEGRDEIRERQQSVNMWLKRRSGEEDVLAQTHSARSRFQARSSRKGAKRHLRNQVTNVAQVCGVRTRHPCTTAATRHAAQQRHRSKTVRHAALSSCSRPITMPDP